MNHRDTEILSERMEAERRRKVERCLSDAMRYCRRMRRGKATVQDLIDALGSVENAIDAARNDAGQCLIIQIAAKSILEMIGGDVP